MVSLNPVLRCVMAVEEGIARGQSVRDIILRWLDDEMRNSASSFSRSARETESERSFRENILGFLRQTESAVEKPAGISGHGGNERTFQTLYRQSFFLILENGVQGSSILPRLKELRLEIESQLELDMKAHIDSLPLKMLIPLLLCMFPAFLVLLLGPITQSFMETMK